MSFLPIAVIAYIFNAGALLIDRILIRTSLSNPAIYTFYVNLLQLLVVFLIPFGYHFSLNNAFYLAVASGVLSVLAFYAYFTSLKLNEASVVGPVVGTFNPLFSLILGGFLFASQALSTTQHLAFFVLLTGTVILTWNLWRQGLNLNRKFVMMVVSGFFFGFSYVLLRQSFVESSFLDGFINSRVASGIFVLSFLLFPEVKKPILQFFYKESQVTSSQANESSRSTLILLGAGQIMGAISVTLITFGVSLASPALVNALFGVQYLVILIVSLLLAKSHPHLLEEKLSQRVIARKTLGALVISLGLYLLAK